jgi:hypothetical protein
MAAARLIASQIRRRGILATRSFGMRLALTDHSRRWQASHIDQSRSALAGPGAASRSSCWPRYEGSPKVLTLRICRRRRRRWPDRLP